MEFMVPSISCVALVPQHSLHVFFPQVFCFKCFSRVSLTCVLLWCSSLSPSYTHAHTAPSGSPDFHADPPVHKLIVSPAWCLCFNSPQSSSWPLDEKLRAVFHWSKGRVLADTQQTSSTVYCNNFGLSQRRNLEWQRGPCQQKEVVYKIQIILKWWYLHAAFISRYFQITSPRFQCNLSMTISYPLKNVNK